MCAAGKLAFVLALGAGVAAPASGATADAPGLPALECQAEQTGGFHDDPGGEESYAPALFHPQKFTLEENLVFMMNLEGTEGNVDLYLTMTREFTAVDGTGPVLDTAELECRRVRGAGNAAGYSCVNVPPSEMLLINAETLRFTRTAAGGWTFSRAGADSPDGGSSEGTEAHGGDSIFVEFGQCQRAEP
jgi:hypothetical protein